MLRVWLVLAALVVAMLGASGAAAAPGRRVALVVGNSAYSNWDSLKNPVGDAHMIAKRLHEIGFDEVVESSDADISKLSEALRTFSGVAQGASLAVIYYTGHGAQFGGASYIIPTDAPLAATLRTQNADNYAIPVKRLIDAAGEGRVGLVLIDACRENVGHDPPSAGGGTKGARPDYGIPLQDLPIPQGVLVQTSTKANMPAYDGSGDHSLYALAVDEHLGDTGMELRGLLKAVKEQVYKSDPRQDPQLEDHLGPAVWVSLDGRDPPPDFAPPRTAQDDAVAEDEGAWKALRETNSINGYETYLKVQPKGRHRAEALAAIEALRAAARAAGPQLTGSLDEARRALASISDAEWRSETPTVLAVKVLARTTGPGVRALSDTGDDRATVVLAALLDQGYGGLKQDRPQATMLYQRAAAHKNAIAQRVMGEFVRTGRDGAPPKPADALPYFQAAADLGDAAAQDRLASLLADGVGGPAGRKKAAAYYQMAANQDDAWAQCHLAAVFANGALGQKPDPKKAVTYAEKSADQGNYCGEMLLAHMNLFGEFGLKTDPDRGAALYEKAAEQGFPEPLTSLGLLYQSGDGLPKDARKAAGYYGRAADMGYARAQYLLGALYAQGADGVPRDVDRAVENFKRAAAQNFPAGLAALGWAYAEGLGGLKRDEAEAVRLFGLAAAADDPDGLYRLGLMTAYGRGGAVKNATEARRLMKAAATQGSKLAERWLSAQF